MEAECSMPGSCGNFQNSALGALSLGGTQTSEVMHITEKFCRRSPDSSATLPQAVSRQGNWYCSKRNAPPPLRLMHLNTWVPVGDALGEGCGTLKR